MTKLQPQLVTMKTVTEKVDVATTCVACVLQCTTHNWLMRCAVRCSEQWLRLYVLNIGTIICAEGSWS